MSADRNRKVMPSSGNPSGSSKLTRLLLPRLAPSTRCNILPTHFTEASIVDLISIFHYDFNTQHLQQSRKPSLSIYVIHDVRVMQAIAFAEWLGAEKGCEDGIATVIADRTSITIASNPSTRTWSLATCRPVHAIHFSI
jgi:hypothetical protein